MVLKTKLSMGLGFLFVIIFALAFFCSYYVEKLSNEADSILRNNYDSIVYSRNMMTALDDMETSISSSIFNQNDNKKLTDYYSQLFESGRIEIEKNLKAEKNNITEVHEKEYADILDKDYNIYLSLCEQTKKGAGSSSMYFNEVLPCYERLKQSIHIINDLNMQAVVRKSQAAKDEAAHIITYMAVTATLCLILAFGYFWYFPFYISNTVTYLSNRMKDLLKENGIDADIKTNDEAYIILQSIKLLEKKLGVEGTEKDTL
ncbi:MAG: hypothetical protein ABSE89_01990 [Sedimentisphaerales bacterium]